MPTLIDLPPDVVKVICESIGNPMTLTQDLKLLPRSLFTPFDEKRQSQHQSLRALGQVHSTLREHVLGLRLPWRRIKVDRTEAAVARLERSGGPDWARAVSCLEIDFRGNADSNISAEQLATAIAPFLAHLSNLQNVSFTLNPNDKAQVDGLTLVTETAARAKMRDSLLLVELFFWDQDYLSNAELNPCPQWGKCTGVRSLDAVVKLSEQSSRLSTFILRGWSCLEECHQAASVFTAFRLTPRPITVRLVISISPEEFGEIRINVNSVAIKRGRRGHWSFPMLPDSILVEAYRIAALYDMPRLEGNATLDDESPRHKAQADAVFEAVNRSPSLFVVSFPNERPRNMWWGVWRKEYAGRIPTFSGYTFLPEDETTNVQVIAPLEEGHLAILEAEADRVYEEEQARKKDAEEQQTNAER